MAKDDANCGELRDLLGDAAYGGDRKLAVKLDTAHLAFRAPKNLVFLPGVMGSLLESKTRAGSGGLTFALAIESTTLSPLR